MSKDRKQLEDVAAKSPDKLKEMESLFWTEAQKHQVLPLDSATFTLLVLPRPSLAAGRTVFTYSGEMTGTPNSRAPNIIRASYSFKGEVEIPPSGAEGMVVTQGGRFAGYGFRLLKGEPVSLWNLVDLQRVRWEVPEALSPGKHILEFDFKYDSRRAATLVFNSTSGPGRSGMGMLRVDGKLVAEQKVEKAIRLTLEWDENFDVGTATETRVDDQDYEAPFKLTGKLNKLTLNGRAAEVTPADVEKLKQAAASAAAIQH
jgi:hypothetical protein